MKVHDEEFMEELLREGTVDTLVDFAVYMDNSEYIAPKEGEPGKLRVSLDFLNYTGCYCEINVYIREVKEAKITLKYSHAIKFFNTENEKFDSLPELEDNILIKVFDVNLLNYGGYDPRYLFDNLLNEEYSDELYKQYLADLENGVLFLQKEGEIIGRFILVEYKDGLVKIIG